MKHRRMKATISAPSPMPQTAEEMSYRLRGDSASSGGGMEHNGGIHKYGMAATTFLGEKPRPFLGGATPLMVTDVCVFVYRWAGH